MKWKETPWPRLLRAKVIRISERCFSTKPNALFNNRIEIENLEKNSNYYYDCYVHWLLFKNTIKRKRKTKKKSNPTTHIMYEIWMMKWRILIFIHIHMQLHLHLWQYGLWSFQMGHTKLDRFLPKNQHTQSKLLNFEF